MDYESGNDTAENLFEGHETVDTIPLPNIAPEQRPSVGLAPLSPPSYDTQPTQILDRATTTPDRGRRSPVVQVAASSPIAAPNAFCAPSKFKNPSGALASRMAPPGTAFRPPVGFPKHDAIVDLSSDDDVPKVRATSSDEESEPRRGADIRPSKFVKSVQTDKASTSTTRFKEITTQAFYKPLQNPTAAHQITSRSSDPQRQHAWLTAPKRTADAMADAYGNACRPLRVPQKASAKAETWKDFTLDDIQDYQIRTKVARINSILPTKAIAVCKAALIHKKGNFDDTIDYLVALDDESTAIDLTLSDNELSLPQLWKSGKPHVKQQLKGPAKSIQSKWAATPALSQQKEASISSPQNPSVVKPRRRLVQGRRQLPSPRRTASRKVSPATPEKVVPVDIDTPSDSAIEPDSSNDYELDRKVLSFFNTCTSDQLADIAGITETLASSLLSHKPFKNLDAIRKIPAEGKSNAKTKPKRPMGDKIVDTCIEMWRGYDAIDGLVQNCEAISKPIVDQIKDWGVDVYGSASDGGLDLIDFEHKSGGGQSLRDSGIGTPTSTIDSADEEANIKTTAKTARNGGFGQPLLLNEDVVLKDYQIVGVNWLALLFEKRLSCILADDMGLGKTCQVIAFLAHLYEKGNKGLHLVIVPGSTIENWLREFRNFCPKLSVMPYYGKSHHEPSFIHSADLIFTAGQTERVFIRQQIEENLDDINVIVTTYGVAKAKDDCKFLRRLPLQVCVYDEGHILKNRKSAAYEQLTRFKSTFRLLLTGTPLQNNLSELVSLLAFIMPQMFKEHSEDLEIIFSQKVKTSNDSHAALLSAQRIRRARSMMTPFILRRKKHQVLKHLPQKKTRVEYCDLAPSQVDIYDSEKARGLRILSDRAADRAAGIKVGNETANVMMALRKAAIHPLLFRRVYDNKTLRKMARECLKEEAFSGSEYSLCLEDMSVMMDFELHRFCHKYTSTMAKYRLHKEEWMDSGKVSKLAELLTTFKQNGDRVLVFSQFVMVMDILEEVMQTLGMTFLRLDGQTKIDERQDMIDMFYADKSITVFMLSTKAGGAGINLACANKVVIFDSSFNPQDDIQAENRAHRVGQTREVEVVRLVTKGTIEEQIHALGQTKLALDDRVAGEADITNETTALEDDKQAEKQGQRAVEKMMIKQMKGEQEVK
ncbi:MAG: hypothetical protein Q9202_006034 [Teloschistes flavicans]